MANVIRYMEESDAVQVLEWRNHIDVKRWMFDQSAITLEQHLSWFIKAQKDPTKHLLIFEKDGVPQGFINFSLKKPGETYEWGFYVAPSSEKGTGFSLGEAALDYGFKSLGFHKVVGQVLDYNHRSCKFHEKLGFSQEGFFKEHHYDGATYHDVYSYGLLEKNWKLKHE